MLQQTQVERVIPKYLEFMDRFPTTTDLAGATLAEVLRVWSGLGFNRRAKMLWQAANLIECRFSGHIPNRTEELRSLPGVGAYTAGAILAFAFNKPVVMLETNIRAVYLYHFDDVLVSKPVEDKNLLSLIEVTLDRSEPRDFYNGLMDYGAYLKSVVENPTRKSVMYSKQSRFEGSDRQIRGQVLKLFIQKTPWEQNKLIESLDADEQRVLRILKIMADEGLVVEKGLKWRLA